MYHGTVYGVFGFALVLQDYLHQYVFLDSLFLIILRLHENSWSKISYYPLELYLLIKNTIYSLTESLFTRLIIAVTGDL